MEPDKQWGISEGSNLYPPNALPGGSGKPDQPMGTYLAQAYGHGAIYVDLFGWQNTGSAFRTVLTDPTALQAYRRFLQGGTPQASQSFLARPLAWSGSGITARK